jgi:hypothetical protein
MIYEVKMTGKEALELLVEHAKAANRDGWDIRMSTKDAEAFTLTIVDQMYPNGPRTYHTAKEFLEATKRWT